VDEPEPQPARVFERRLAGLREHAPLDRGDPGAVVRDGDAVPSPSGSTATSTIGWSPSLWTTAFSNTFRTADSNSSSAHTTAAPGVDTVTVARGNDDSSDSQSRVTSSDRSISARAPSLWSATSISRGLVAEVCQRLDLPIDDVEVVVALLVDMVSEEVRVSADNVRVVLQIVSENPIEDL